MAFLFWYFSSAKTERTRAQGFTAVFGLFLVPSKHMPSAAFQRAMLHGEAPLGTAGLLWRNLVDQVPEGMVDMCTHTYIHT